MEPMQTFANDEKTRDYLAQHVEKPVSPVRYAAVKALILYWENSDKPSEYHEEARNVECFFRKMKYETELYPIPDIGSQLAVNAFIAKHAHQLSLANGISSLGAPCLLIVHYGGHGDKNDDRHFTGPGGPQKRRAVWRAQRTGGPHVRWYEVQKLFRDIPFDVLLLFDCCYAAQTGRSAGQDTPGEPPGRVELLAAAGDRAETPQPGDGSFTTIMIKTMEKLIEKDHKIDILELHTRLVRRDAKLYTTPFHVQIRAGPTKRSVILEQLKSPEEYQDSAVAWKAAVRITIGMREPLNDAVMDEIGRWLHADAPGAFVAGLKVESVLQQTASISNFIQDSLPNRSSAIAQSLDVPILQQIGEAWGELHHLVSRYKLRQSVPGFAEQKEHMEKLANDFVKRLNAGNTEVIELVEKAIMMSGASSTTSQINKTLEDPASESLGISSQLVLRRIICRQQSPNHKANVTATRSTVSVYSDRLLEECKIYDEHQSPQEIKDMGARIGLLAEVLESQKPQSFRSLQLYEWKHEQHKRHFVYHFRIPDNCSNQYKTLYEVITKLRRHLRPTLEERLTMASSIAKAVEQWHRVDWVHQSISSHNIIFLQPLSAASDARLQFHAPFLHGFDFARPNAKPSIGRYVEDIKHDIYRHPDRQGEVRDGHKKEHDLYSLGVVLLEIGLWRSTQDLVEDRAKPPQKPPKPPKLKSEAFQVAKKDMVKWLADAAQDSLAHYVGSEYRDVVRTCLTSEFGVTQDDERKSRLLDAMDRMVLQKLKRKPVA
ncbi:hypothetical protein J4E89_001895 [Alternaria sp. Ai002NY15]|nr:hypothetical protein J4E89_001895 [Alternaria sp. Ai002NY15]